MERRADHIKDVGRITRQMYDEIFHRGFLHCGTVRLQSECFL